MNCALKLQDIYNLKLYTFSACAISLTCIWNARFIYAASIIERVPCAWYCSSQCSCDASIWLLPQLYGKAQ